jgi:spermidine synthase
MNEQAVISEDRASGNALPAVNWWWGVAFFYGLSGFVSLAYEVLWSRMLSMQFGVSIFGVVLTVTAFMIGLGGGSLTGAYWAGRSRKPLVVFAAIEMGIALYALMLPGLMRWMSLWLGDVAGKLGLMQWYLLQALEAFGLLLIPAFAMGAGFALVLKAVDRTPLTLGKLYGLNTTGGALGALFPLWGLPVLGWVGSVRIVALLGFLAGAAALYFSRYLRTIHDDAVKVGESHPPFSALLLYAGIGAGSLMLEVGWVRLYGMILLRTEYVLGVILAVFLAGIALGSLFVPRLKKHWVSVMLPFLAGGGVLLGLWFLPAASAWVEGSQFRSFFGAVSSQAMVAALFTLPVTLALGAWLPWLAQRYEHASGVWLYGANCLGGGLGALLACLVIIPYFGSVAMVVIAGLAISAFGLASVGARWGWLGFPVLMLLAWPLHSMPPVHELLPIAEAGSRDLYLYEDAVSLTHVVRHRDGQRILLTDLQRMDASSDPSAVEIQMDQARLALLLHPDPHSVLFLGLGTGISMAGSAPFPKLDRSAVELSQGAIYAASRWFSEVNGGIVSQAGIYRDDARHYLNTTSRHYDVIIGDLFHPDLAGMGSLLSVQQFQRARNHLSADGVFVQWLALNQFDRRSLEVVFRSFRQVFPDAQMFMDGMHLALVGPNKPYSIVDAMQRNLARVKDDEPATGGEGMWTWLGRYWGPIPESTGSIQDEWLPYIEYSLPKARYDGSVNLAGLMSQLMRLHPDVGTAANILGVAKQDREAFGRAYMAATLNAQGWIAAIQGDEAKSVQMIWLAYQANPHDHWIANALADSMMQSLIEAREHGLSEREALQRILQIAPDHVNALRALWHLEKDQGNMQEAERYRLRLLAVSPLDSEANGAL